MAGISEPIALALIACIGAIITAFIGAARTAAKPPAEHADAKPSSYTVSLDDDARDAIQTIADAVEDAAKAINELRHELMRRR